MRLVYYCKEGWKNTKRYPYSGFYAVLVIGLVLSVLGIFSLVGVNLIHARYIFTQELKILVFIKNNVQAEIPILMEQIKKIDGVSNVKFISRDQALQELAEKKDMRQEINILGFNPLPDLIEVKSHNAFIPGQLEAIAEQIIQYPAVDTVEFGQEHLEELIGVLSTAEYFTIVIGSVISGLILLLGLITLRFTLYNRKNDMEIMELVGLSPGFIKTPILIESIFYGILGSILGLSFLYALYNITKLRIENIIFIDYLILTGLFIMGILLSLISLWLELSRPLRNIKYREY